MVPPMTEAMANPHRTSFPSITEERSQQLPLSNIALEFPLVLPLFELRVRKNQ